jgi:hypothetical protein
MGIEQHHRIMKNTKTPRKLIRSMIILFLIRKASVWFDSLLLSAIYLL